MSAKSSKKRPKIRLFDDFSSNSPSEADLDPFEDNDGDYGSDTNYEPQNIEETGASSSSEEIFSIRPRRIISGGPVASSDSSKSDISIRSSDSDQDDRTIENAEPISESVDDLPSLLISQHDNDIDSEPVQNRIRSPVPEEIPWLHSTEEIPDFEFDVESYGVQFDVTSQTSIEQIFDHVFPKELLEYLVQCTNNYGTALCQSNKPSTRYSRSQNFRNTTTVEMKKFLGLSLLHGHIRTPKQQKLFTYDDPLYYHPVFSYTMSSRRYEQILRCICCSELDAKGAEKINKFVDLLTLNFRKIYKPDKELSLDESLLLYRGRLHFRQYIKSKKARYGIKFYVLATADGYVLNIIMYSGKDENTQLRGVTKLERLVMRLMRPFLLKGHHLFMDNYYNSVTLSQKLFDLKTHTNGTLRVNRKDNPKEVVDRKLKKGDHVWVRKNKVYVSKWVDKRPVIMLTTREHPRIIETTNRFGKIVKKPIEVATYNKYMSGVDRSDQMISYYSSPRKTIRWYKKVLFHLLDTAVWNSYYLYKKFVLKNPKYELSSYREELIKKLIDLKENCKGKDLVLDLKKHNSRKHNNPQKNIFADQERKFWGHWPKRQPAPENSKKKYSFLMCKMCSKNKKRVETSYRCIGCPGLPPLCPECFQDYHQILEQQEQ
ncbi:piggyBac transposable element-derived protein 4-like isoform X1 [Bombyx mori]|uniref:PiggyBac transposable element-derived protein domain-containing protein n=1 Tax=Bombyx mori TaxID=7091 RepID=A0A8R2R5N9_BOMMO|nr:piggyBac transposable element-derived protein 4-like isoform X1 [Bombyx mori]XP_037873305.1 piggyBac transposable element-derived protein 4-like isoform X1 [Bombyx mori]